MLISLAHHTFYLIHEGCYEFQIGVANQYFYLFEHLGYMVIGI